MKKNFLLSIISTFLLPSQVFCAEENEIIRLGDNDFEEKNESNNGDQSIFNEENENNNSEEDTVNLFQFSIDSIQQSLNYNFEVLDCVKKFILSISLGQEGFNVKNYLNQYICCKKFQFLSLKDLQNCKQNFEIVDCFIDLGKINNLKKVKLEESNQIFYFINSLIYEYLATNKGRSSDFKIKPILDGEMIKKIFSNSKNRQRVNKFIKETFVIKKNIDFCQHLHFVVLNYKNTFSVESLEKLFSQNKIFDEKDFFEKQEPSFSQFITDLRHLDGDNDEYQSSLDVVSQNIIKSSSLLKSFLFALVDKPICGVKNTEIEQNIKFFTYNYCKS